MVNKAENVHMLCLSNKTTRSSSHIMPFTMYVCMIVSSYIQHTCVCVSKMVAFFLPLQQTKTKQEKKSERQSTRAIGAKPHADCVALSHFIGKKEFIFSAMHLKINNYTMKECYYPWRKRSIFSFKSHKFMKIAIRVSDIVCLLCFAWLSMSLNHCYCFSFSPYKQG